MLIISSVDGTTARRQLHRMVRADTCDASFHTPLLSYLQQAWLVHKPGNSFFGVPRRIPLSDEVKHLETGNSGYSTLTRCISPLNSMIGTGSARKNALTSRIGT